LSLYARQLNVNDDHLRLLLAIYVLNLTPLNDPNNNNLTTITDIKTYMISEKILIISNNNAANHELKIILTFLGKEIIFCNTSLLDKQFNYWQDFNFSCVIIDEDIYDDKLITTLIKLDEFIPIILITNEITIPDKRILNTIQLPVNHSKLIDTLHRAQIYKESKDKSITTRPAHLFRSLVGSSRAITEVKTLMEQVASTDATVLILGESGTGKEVVARNLHYSSKGKNAPFVAVNCGAISPELLESELFGHEKGAFTGAVSARAGRFEQANNGTLFLDEIGDMPLNMQVKLLRVLQERTFERVGGNKIHHTNVRIIAATHQDLPLMIKNNQFREDLYYRLNVFPITMPPLRERSEDIPLLINDFLRKLEREQKSTLRFNSAAIMALCCYSWPGNVRELANLIARMAITHPHKIVDIKDLPAYFHYLNTTDEIMQNQNFDLKEDEVIDLKGYLANLERHFITQALDNSNWVVSNAALKLKLRRTTLVEKMRKYKITR